MSTALIADYPCELLLHVLQHACVHASALCITHYYTTFQNNPIHPFITTFSFMFSSITTFIEDVIARISKVICLQGIIFKMSSQGRREMGANEKALKYQFTLELLRFSGCAPLNCKLKFMWRRNNKSIETKQELQLKAGAFCQLELAEKVSSISTIVLNVDRREFHPKESQLIANMLFNGSPKKLASYALDMRCILDPNGHHKNRAQQFDVEMASLVGGQPCRLVFKLSSVFKEELTSERSLGNASLNMSGLSIPQEGRYFDKRYQVVPSKDSKDTQSVVAKDTHSVASYNPSTYGGRYPSAKREREEPRKFDYGYLAALKSNVLPSDPDTRSHKKSLDNKTDNNDGAYNRQLGEEQQRRSKAEAELVKNKVEIEELKRKLADLAIENLQLKDRASREDATALQHRLYELNNQLRTAASDLQRAESQAKSAILDKANLESELLRWQKRAEAIESLHAENGQLKHQLQATRRAAEQLRRQAQDREGQLLTDKFREQQEGSARLDSLRRENDRLRASSQAQQRRLSELQGELRTVSQELVTKTRYILSTERAGEEQKSRLEQLQTERAKLEQERSLGDGKVSKLLAHANETQKKVVELQSECLVLREQAGRLEKANQQLRQAQVRQAQQAQVQAQTKGPENDEYFLKSVKLEVELKYATEQLQRLRETQERLEQQRWKAQHQHSEREAAEKELQRVQKELAAKNRALMVEAGKTQMMTDTINELEGSNELLREQLEKARAIIHSGQQQLSALDNHNQQLQNALHQIHAEREDERLLAGRARELLGRTGELEARLRDYEGKMREYDSKVRELEDRNAQKLANLQANNHILLLARREAEQAQRVAEQAVRRSQEIQGRALAAEGELARGGQERRVLQKRMEVVMEEMHNMKKRFEEQKGRSVSFTRNEDLHRLRSLQSQVQKKEKTVSRLSKEKLELEEENVKMNVQIMKLYSQLEKYKANPHSLKHIASLK